MKIKEIMTPKVATVDVASTVRDAARQMRNFDVGVLPVAENGRLVGMLSDRDIAIRAVAEGKNPDVISVREAMTPDVATCYEDQDAEEAGRVMKDRQVRRLVVLDRHEQVVGVCSVGDLAVHTQGGRLGGDILHATARPPDEQMK